MVFDRRVALLPADPLDLSAGAVEFDQPSVVAATVALFEQVWSTARDPRKGGVPPIVLTTREQAIVALLAEGQTDPVVARHLGIERADDRVHAARAHGSAGGGEPVPTRAGPRRRTRGHPAGHRTENGGRMNRFLVTVLNTALVAASLAVVPPAAQAAPVNYAVWPGYACPAGALDPASLRSEPMPDGHSLLVLDGRLECGLPDGLSRFGVGVFTPGGIYAVMYPSMLQTYAPTAPTVFHTSVPVQRGKQKGWCLFTSSRRLLSCVTVTVATDGTATAEPLDPAQWPIGAVNPPDNGHPQPQCNTCWSSRL